MWVHSCYCLILGAVLAAAGSTDGRWDQARALRGVHPSKRQAYTASSGADLFRCLDGSKQIPFAAVNDDYCDCPDGSDEPGTPACEKGFFHCLNDDHIGADIPTSRVNDGICDPQCCDGSDEYLGYVKCHNNCTEIGATYRKEVLAKRRVVAEGEKIAREYAEFGAKAAADRTAEISILTNKIEKLDKKVKDLQDKKAAAEEFAKLHGNESVTEDESRQPPSAETSKRQDKCCAAKLKCVTMLDEQIGGTLMVQDRLEFLQEGAHHIDNIEPATREKDPAAADAYDAYQSYKLTWAPEDEEEANLGDTPAAEEEGAAATSRDCCTRVEECKKKVEEEQDKFLQLSDKLEALLGAVSPLGKAKPKTRRQDDWVRRAYEQYADYKLQFRGEKIPPVQDLAGLEKEEQKEEEVPAPTSDERNTEKPAASETPRDDSCAAAADVLASAFTDPQQVVKCAPAIVSKYAVSLYDTVSTQLKATLGRVGSSRSAVPPPGGGADVTKVAARLIEAEAVRTEATTKLAELRRLAEIDFGPAGVWEKLYRTCVTTETAEYTYEVCILDRAVQKPKNGGAQTGLGTFKRWGVRDPSKATAENAHHAMMYEDGDRCWNGPARSVEVTVECGLETKLLSVVEMSKCEYNARLTSPAVCDLSKLDVLPPAWHEHNEL
ncbi:hypothetical protein HDU88_005329 [Geranomyces variabilis]|nr:hypothetical protein HDU88_005329 [Geranomyces variabilis]